MNIPTVEFPKSLTDEEVEFLKESNAIEGVEDYLSLQQAAFAWEYLKEQDHLTLRVILKTHKIIALHSNLYPNQKGYFREVPVWVGGREGAIWREIKTKLREWIKVMNEGTSDPIRLHVEYEKIHPFVDFNGRTGRLFLNWQLTVKQKKPLMIIKESERQKYYKWFK